MYDQALAIGEYPPPTSNKVYYLAGPIEMDIHPLSDFLPEEEVKKIDVQIRQVIDALMVKLDPSAQLR